MKILYQTTYLSLDEFTPVTAPPFLVLTGVNGAGKSHLLKALENRHAVIEGLEAEKVIYFNYMDFFLENESSFGATQLTNDRKQAYELFVSRIKSQIASFKSGIGNGYTKLGEVAKAKGKALWDLKKEDIQDDSLHGSLTGYRTNVLNLFRDPNLINNQHAQSILVLQKQLPYSLDEISQEEFFVQYKPYQFKNDFLPIQLGRIIWDYYVRWRQNRTHTYENKEEGRVHKVLSDKEFTKKYGEKPWVIVNTILKKFNSLSYTIDSPEGLDILEDYQLKLTHAQKKIFVNFSDMSSGERILMALVASIFKSSSDTHFPAILLLDEVDASLHPSMIQSFLDVINDIFIKQGTQVILVTHSPTTVALSPDESVFIMNSSGKDRIVKNPKSDAIKILTEGFATLEEGIRLADQIGKKKLSVFSEGDNILYLEKALDFLNPSLKSNIEFVKGVEDITGKGQLDTLFQFFSKLSHKNKVMFVWDCDVKANHTRINDTIPYYFIKNTGNTKVKNGIENLFPEKHFIDEYYIQGSKEDGGTFTTLNKPKFATYMLNKGTKDDFSEFKPLVDEMESILSETT